MEKRFRFRHVNELTGLFVLLVLALIIAAVLFTGRSQHWFSGRFVFDAHLPSGGAFGLKQGSEVFILGISAGVIDTIRVADDGHITAQAVIRADFAQFVRSDSIGSIKKVFGIGGDSFLEVSRGRADPLPEKDPSIRCQSSDELPNLVESMLAEIRAEIMPLVKRAGATLEKTGTAMDAWGELGGELKKTQGKLGQVFTRFDTVVAGIEQGEGTVGHLLKDKSLATDLEELVARGNTMMDELRKLTKNLQQGTERLPAISKSLADEARDLPGLVIQTQQTLHEMEKLVAGLQKHWLVQKYMEPPPSSPRLRPEQAGEGPR